MKQTKQAEAVKVKVEQVKEKAEVVKQRIKTLSEHSKEDLLNLVYNHKRRLLIGATFCSGYYYFCSNMVTHPSEILRLGVAGSLANMAVECGFHLMDTINIRSKVSSPSEQHKSTF